VGTRIFFMPATPPLEGNTSATAYLQIFKNCSATAFQHNRNRNFLQQSATSILHLFLKTCCSAMHITYSAKLFLAVSYFKSATFLSNVAWQVYLYSKSYNCSDIRNFKSAF
jgi:deoxyribodipyrimidine photolyase